MKNFYRFLVLCFSIALSTGSAQEYTKADQFTLETRELAVIIRPEAAFTIGGITFEGMPVGKKNGNYGMVISHEGTEFIGSGHTEGGREAIQNVSLTVDGKVYDDIPVGQEVSAQEAVLNKTSLLGDEVELKSEMKIKDHTIFISNTMTIKQDVLLGNVYPHMFIWPETTTEYMAGLLNGQVVEGKFDNTGWEVQADVRWMAAYEPNFGVIILTTFPEDFPKADENTRKHTYWDLEAYHKQYFIFASRREFKEGETFKFDVEVKFLHADPSVWKETLAKELNLE